MSKLRKLSSMLDIDTIHCAHNCESLEISDRVPSHFIHPCLWCHFVIAVCLNQYFSEFTFAEFGDVKRNFKFKMSHLWLLVMVNS